MSNKLTERPCCGTWDNEPHVGWYLTAGGKWQIDDFDGPHCATFRGAP